MGPLYKGTIKCPLLFQGDKNDLKQVEDDAKEAIEAYEVAVHDPSIDTEELKNFIMTQVQRIKEKGPQYGSPIPGLIYQLM